MSWGLVYHILALGHYVRGVIAFMGGDDFTQYLQTGILLTILANQVSK